MLANSVYLNDLRCKKLKTHKDALKHLPVRLMSFNQAYFRDCPMPASVLADLGYHCDNKRLKCFECDFEYSKLEQDNLHKLSHEHYIHNKECSQVKRAYEYSQENQELFSSPIETTSNITTAALNESLTNTMEIDVDISENVNGKTNALTSPGSSKRSKNLMSVKENRLKTFDNVRLLLKVEELVANGLYLASNHAEREDMAPEVYVHESSAEKSHFASMAANVPALMHVKCAFCTYECLLFKNSTYNTMFKSPIDEHKEKFFDSCSIFKDQNSESAKASASSTSLVLSPSVIKQLDWLQLLIDTSSIDDYRPVSDFVVMILETNDIIVKQIPKIIDSLVLSEINKNNTEMNDPNGENNGIMLYNPNSDSNNFQSIQNVLSASKNVIRDKAKHPQFSIYQNRLDSFRDWPATMSQQPDQLAKAGFYYYGIKDMVKCFFCNGGLKNWDHNDDPFEDHVRWFPSCQFIQQLMGRDYIEKIRIKYEDADSGFDSLDMAQFNSSKNMKPSGNQAAKGSTQKPKRSVSPRTLNSRLDTVIVRRIMDQKILARDSIKHAFESKLSDSPSQEVYGDDFKSPLEMARLALDFETLKKDKIDSFNRLSDIIIGHLPLQVKIDNLVDLFGIRYDVYPESIRILREEGLSNKRCFCLITLREKDKQNASILDEIVRDLNSKQYPGFTDTDPIVVIRTNWNALERQIPSLVSKPAVVSTAMVSSVSAAQLASPATAGPANNAPQSEQKPSPTPKAEAKPPTTDNKDEPMHDLEENELREENERLKSQRLCVVCLSKDKNVLFLPCAHLASCLDCSLALPNCPICRTKIQATVRTYT